MSSTSKHNNGSRQTKRVGTVD